MFVIVSRTPRLSVARLAERGSSDHLTSTDICFRKVEMRAMVFCMTRGMSYPHPGSSQAPPTAAPRFEDEEGKRKNGSYSVSCWYGPFPMALLIQFCGVVWSAQASSARRQPR